MSGYFKLTDEQIGRAINKVKVYDKFLEYHRAYIKVAFRKENKIDLNYDLYFNDLGELTHWKKYCRKI